MMTMKRKKKEMEGDGWMPQWYADLFHSLKKMKEEEEEEGCCNSFFMILARAFFRYIYCCLAM